jgi:hypothetical protein
MQSEGQIMEARGLLPSQSRASEKVIPSIFLSHSWSGAVVGSLTVAMDDGRFDQHALLRWADDGGRWVGDGNCTVPEVRT